MAEWLTSPAAWFTFGFEVFVAFGLGYNIRGLVERIKRDRRNQR